MSAYEHGLPSLLISSVPPPPPSWPTPLPFFFQPGGSFPPPAVLMVGSGHLFFPTNSPIQADGTLAPLQTMGMMLVALSLARWLPAPA